MKKGDRVSRSALRAHFKGLSFPQRVQAYLHVRFLMHNAFERNPGKARKELAEHDRANPKDRLGLKV
jgi:hypothetical protein